MMYDLAKMFLYCFNHWKLETPTNHAHSSPTDDHKVYKENYTRQERGREGGEGGREGEREGNSHGVFNFISLQVDLFLSRSSVL